MGLHRLGASCFHATDIKLACEFAILATLKCTSACFMTCGMLFSPALPLTHSLCQSDSILTPSTLLLACFPRIAKHFTLKSCGRIHLYAAIHEEIAVRVDTSSHFKATLPVRSFSRHSHNTYLILLCRRLHASGTWLA